MKQFVRRIIVSVLMLALMVPVFVTGVNAAGSWPSLSSKKYCEFVADRNINVYRNSGCTTRGTCDPAKSYKAYIADGDACRIIEISSKYVKVEYPTSSGYRTGYIKRSSILGVSSPSDVVEAKKKVTTYTAAGGRKYGYIAKGDTVYVCGKDGSYTIVIYEAKSGSQAYKLGYVKTSDFTSASSGSSGGNSGVTSSSWDKKVGTQVAKIKSGNSYTKYYGSEGNISAAGGYIGQCTWYAYGRFYEVTGIKLKTARDAKRWLDENENDARVTVVYGASEIVPKSIAVRTSGTYGHVMFIEHVTYDNGKPSYVYFTECNADGDGKYTSGKDAILQRMTYEDFVSKKKPAGYIVAD